MTDHLTPHALARLVDATPAADEARHLDDCARCRASLERMRATREVLRELPPPALADEAWDRLRGDVRYRRLVRDARRSRRWVRAAAMGAAALALFATGLATGARLGRRGPAVAPPAAAAEDPGDAATLTVRLAALESIVRSTGLAVAQAPNDAVLARIYRAALDERRRAWQQATPPRDGLWF